jgi:hypothetical protein
MLCYLRARDVRGHVVTKQSKGRTKNPPTRGQGKRGKTCRNYEEVATYVLKQVRKRFELTDVEGKQKVTGTHTGVSWEIDAKGIRESDGALIVIEYRRYTSSGLSQEALAAIAYRVIDTGAAGGITVSPHPLQRGAERIAKVANVQHVQLDPSSTRDQWIAKIQGIMIFGHTETARISITDGFHIEMRDGAGNVIEERSQ